MSVALGVLAAASTLATPLPALPAQGLVVAEPGGITFVSASGRRLGHLRGFHFAPQDTNVARGLPRLRDRSAHLWRVDLEKRRLVPADTGTPLFGGATLTFRRQARTWVLQRASCA